MFSVPCFGNRLYLAMSEINGWHCSDKTPRLDQHLIRLFVMREPAASKSNPNLRLVNWCFAGLAFNMIQWFRTNQKVVHLFEPEQLLRVGPTFLMFKVDAECRFEASYAILNTSPLHPKTKGFVYQAVVASTNQSPSLRNREYAAPARRRSSWMARSPRLCTSAQEWPKNSLLIPFHFKMNDSTWLAIFFWQTLPNGKTSLAIPSKLPYNWLDVSDMVPNEKRPRELWLVEVRILPCRSPRRKCTPSSTSGSAQ